MTEPCDQFQIGDKVIFVPEGVYTTVTGYWWSSDMSGSHAIVSYQLDCGISALRKDLARRGK